MGSMIVIISEFCSREGKYPVPKFWWGGAYTDPGVVGVGWGRGGGKGKHVSKVEKANT